MKTDDQSEDYSIDFSILIFNSPKSSADISCFLLFLSVDGDRGPSN